MNVFFSPEVLSFLGVEVEEEQEQEENPFFNSFNSPVDQSAPRGGVRGVHPVDDCLQRDLARVEARPGGGFGPLSQSKRVEEKDGAEGERMLRRR